MQDLERRELKRGGTRRAKGRSEDAGAAGDQRLASAHADGVLRPADVVADPVKGLLERL
ncbi:MAG: hypothetical protein ACI9MR_001821 [Myxococcota bacterium]|jgi:hypothetical protein